MLFTAEDHSRAAAGEITVTWRLWKYRHVKAGKTYPTGFGGAYSIEDVRPVRACDITDTDAREAGLPNAASLIELARSHTGAAVSPESVLYRVQFHYLPQAPAKPQLSLDEVSKRLARHDENSRRGPWTVATLRLIEENPRTVARRLAYELDWETLDFKVHVRKLKALGLTISHEVGYELSELGQAYLDSIDD